MRRAQGWARGLVWVRALCVGGQLCVSGLLCAGGLAGCGGEAVSTARNGDGPGMMLTGVEVQDFAREGLRWHASAAEVTVSADLETATLRQVTLEEPVRGVRVSGETGELVLREQAVALEPVSATLQPTPVLVASPGGGSIGGSAGAGGTAEAVGDLPVDITADRFLGRAKDGTGAFEGHVVVVRGDMRLRCERLTVEYDRDTQRIVRLTARGRVEIETERRKSRAERVTFEQRTRKITLEGDPVLQDGMDEMRGERIIWELETDQVECQRCRVRLSPRRGGAGSR